jgi:hypothetical protein
MDTIFNSFFKIQVTKTKSYHNINQEIALASEFLYNSPWLRKAMLQTLFAGHLGLDLTV